MKKKYHELPLAKKISFFSALVMFVSIMIFTIVINFFFEKSVLDITSEGYKQKFDIASESSQTILEDAEKIAKVLLTDDIIQNWFLEKSGDIARRLNQKIKVERRLDYLDALYPDNQYSSISVFDLEGNMINSSAIRAKASVYQQFFEVIQNFEEQQGWLDLYNLDLDGYEENGLAYIRYFRDYTSGKIVGYIMMEYRSQLLINNFTHIKYGDTGSYLITDMDGNVKIRDDQDASVNIGAEDFFQWAKENTAGGKVFHVDRQRCLVTADVIPNLEWMMIGITPVEELTQQGKTITAIFYGVGFLAILLSTFFSFQIAHSVTRPLRQLADTMERFGKGELAVHVPVQYRDEIGMLSEEFNKMADQIQQLVEQVYREQRAKRKSELAALQAQINPHFLYNTLNSVASLIRMDCPNEAFTMIHAIGMFYRTSLSDGKTLIPIEQEITNIENYIQIQKIRYGSKIDFIIDISPEIKKEWIVKLTLQPLVENAIYHGVKERRGKGCIRIFGRKEAQMVVLKVSDNGVGIPEEKKEHLLVGSKDGKRYSYGLYNVQQRLQIYFGKEYGLQVTSGFGCEEDWIEENTGSAEKSECSEGYTGTTVTVKIPVGLEHGGS